MLKTRDFYLMKVYDSKGKYLGIIKDISIDFYQAKICGFLISSFSLFNKKNYIPVEEILSIDKDMIVSKIDTFNGLLFNDIKYMDIIDNDNIMRGVLEDIVIDRNNYEIKGFVISSGIIDRMFKGKEIILPSNCILCEDFILYRGKECIKLKSLPHNLGGL